MSKQYRSSDPTKHEYVEPAKRNTGDVSRWHLATCAQYYYMSLMRASTVVLAFDVVGPSPYSSPAPVDSRYKSIYWQPRRLDCHIHNTQTIQA